MFWLRNSCRAFSESRPASLPSKSRVPEVSGSRVLKEYKRVLFPEPDRPVMATHSPSLISNERVLSTTVTAGGCPKDFTIFLATRLISSPFRTKDIYGVHSARPIGGPKTCRQTREERQ